MKDDFEDDGRTVADMSGVERQPMLVPRRIRGEDRLNTKEEGEPLKLDKKQRGAAVWGALSAALLIAAVFAVVGFLFIYTLTKVL